jgi:hypothetical protein
MWWQFKSAFVRKIAFLLAALLFGALLGHRAHSAVTCYVYQGSVAFGGAVTGPCSSFLSAQIAAFAALGPSGSTLTASIASGSGPDIPNAAGQHCTIDVFNSGTLNQTSGGNSVVGACPASCATAPTMNILAAISGSSFSSGGLICVGGCGYTSSGNSLHIGASSTSTGVAGNAVPTGAGCASGDGSAAAQANANCMSSAGVNMCFDSGTGVASIDSDLVNPAVAPPAGACTAFSDGAVVCSAGSKGTLSIIGGPTVSGGGAAVPAAVVTTASNVEDYFTSAEVASSATPVLTKNGGALSGNPSGSQGGSSVPCTPSAIGVSPIVTCSGTSVSTPGNGSGSGTAVGGACPPGQTCTGVSDANSGGLDCTAPPTCTDTDVNMCAIITQSWLSRCASTARSDLETAVALSGEAVSAVASDQSAALTETGPISGSSGACPAPFTFVWQGKTISFDIYKYLCLYAAQIAFAVMFAAYVVGAKNWLGALLQ